MEAADSSSSAERIVNTGFADDEGSPIKPQMPLKPASDYYFWFDIGKLDAEYSIEIIPTGIPDDIPAGAELDVALYSFEDEIEGDFNG